MSTWVHDLSASLLHAYRSAVPDDVLRRAALQTFDAVACAAGAVDAEPVRIARTVTAGSGPAEATVLFDARRASVLDAILVNGTLVRYLDYNDAFVGSGPGGHPSDDIVVALAVGERTGASGRDVLAAVALGYELFWRVRQGIYARGERAGNWDGVSVSGLVSAGIAGLLLDLDEGRLAHAIAIGAGTGYALRQIRRGSISMLKGSANALVARDGTLAALLAAEGMTGPSEVVEGRSGLLRAFGVDAAEDLRAELVAPPDWAIRRVSIKAFPAIATAQAAVSAAVLVHTEDDVVADDVEEVRLHLPDTGATREHLGIEQRQRPDSRESADHSVPFLVACALEDGEVSLAQFEGERWLRPSTVALMQRITVVPDADLVQPDPTCYPAVLRVRLSGGRTVIRTVDATPGSPLAPWGEAEIVRKFARNDRAGLGEAGIDRVRDAVIGLTTAPDLTNFARSIGASAEGGTRDCPAEAGDGARREEEI